MRYFLDTEFIEDGRTIDLLSIGIVAEDGGELYLECSETDQRKANDWVKINVLPHLNGGCFMSTKATLAQVISRLCDPDTYGQPEFWGYYAAYDWVALCQLFGTMMDLPKGWPMFAYDLRQWLNQRGLSHVLQPDDMPHHALSDARWIAEIYKRYADAD